MSSGGVKVNWTILVLGLLLLGGVVGLLAVGFLYDPRRLDTDVLTGQPAPAFVLQDIEGNTVSLEDLKGRPVVINFWSTWCIPCKQEHPLLQRYPPAYPDVTFLGVIYQDKTPAVKAFLKRDPVPYATLVDAESKVAIAYGVTGVPETYFIDAEGKITYKRAGPLSEATLVEQLEALRR